MRKDVSLEPPVDVDDVTLHVQRYWMEDGLVEIMIGLMCVFLAGATLTMGLSVIGVFGLSWGFKKLKARVTFPRSGYVALPKPTGKYWISMFALYAVCFVILHFTTGRTAVPAATVIFALALIVPGLRVRLPRMVWEGALALVVGAVLYLFTDLTGDRGLMVFMATMGTALAITGSLQLRSFLKTHPTFHETEA